MPFDNNSFSQTLLPREITQYTDLLQRLNPGLTEILQEEINHGNKIVNVSTGWPEDKSIVVSVSLPFHKQHEREGITFEISNDPHYWKQGYSSKNPKHLLVY